MLHGSVGESRNICNNAAKWEGSRWNHHTFHVIEKIFDIGPPPAPYYHNLPPDPNHDLKPEA